MYEAAVGKKIAEHEVKIEQLVQVEKDSEVEQAKVIARFKNEGVNNSEVASRLDLSTSVVCKLGKICVEKASEDEQKMTCVPEEMATGMNILV
ncbi:hypothetical protein [Rothia terrae]|uniref:Uncharacterized protein n=1 Tax=Rothia terrae TaxID=396015 RepID=A0A7S6WWB5_9MICC|nr:hypothetical protein [Rothia terrae]QOW64713.1 hypothetical protein IDM49_11460 [Rothia terrae]